LRDVFGPCPGVAGVTSDATAGRSKSQRSATFSATLLRSEWGSSPVSVASVVAFALVCFDRFRPVPLVAAVVAEAALSHSIPW